MKETLTFRYNKNLTEQEVQNLITDYKNGTKIRFLVKKYKLAKSSIKRWLTIFKVPRQTDHRRHSINDNYFEIIDNENKAYMLGLFYADGCNHFSEKRFSITLQEKDNYMIEWIKKELQSTHPIFTKTGKVKDGSLRTYYSISFASKKICNRLSELGCVPRKSLILKFPTSDQVPDHLIHHFIRGYFDGDGSVYHTSNDKKDFKASFSFVGTMEFVLSLKKILLNKANVNLFIGHRVGAYEEKYKNSTSNSFNTSVSGSFQCERGFYFMYKDATIYLNRKYNKFLEICNRKRKRNNKNIKVTNIKLGDIKIYKTYTSLRKELNVNYKTFQKSIKTNKPFNDYLFEYIN